VISVLLSDSALPQLVLLAQWSLLLATKELTPFFLEQDYRDLVSVYDSGRTIFIFFCRENNCALIPFWDSMCHIQKLS